MVPWMEGLDSGVRQYDGLSGQCLQAVCLAFTVIQDGGRRQSRHSGHSATKTGNQCGLIYTIVIPDGAQRRPGVQRDCAYDHWIPASAGMTLRRKIHYSGGNEPIPSSFRTECRVDPESRGLIDTIVIPDAAQRRSGIQRPKNISPIRARCSHPGGGSRENRRRECCRRHVRRWRSSRSPRAGA